MKILLDTHIAIWAVLDSAELSDEARAMILDEDNEIYYSAASVWEITIKHMAHPETFLYSGKHLEKGCEDSGFIALPIFNKHSAELETLVRPKDAPLHKDPFDRILLAQAKSEGMKFMTHDSLIAYYNEPLVIKV
ncbi:MAG: type II toxin-antitoxin system VapC family toxin [Bacteroidales bacterium]|nr:type II toxin-antitoxin system VapC family toxin [Lachnoclostridium sp.]MCM1383148.1 type II toxin-antitoxin system VapC family toxin [Lachnoclostridium sp.]MCM1464626.1 type II toxin-antitoxin system VapC family toxin [Bacteroidales bacterium]